MRNKPIAWMLAVALLATAVLVSPPAKADGGEDEVHVALFVKTKTLNASASVVTLSAEGGLLLSAEDGKEWFRTANASPIRATYDGYRVLVAETSDAAAAQAFAADVRGARQPVAVFAAAAGSGARLRVEAGPYGSKAEAESARTALAANAALAARLAGGTMALTGPWYARTSAHATEAEAAAAAQSLRSAGVHAIVAMARGDGGAAQYEARIGGTADESSLRQAIAAAQAAVPGLAATPLSPETPYVALRSDRAAESGLGDAARHVAVGGGARLSFAPASGAASAAVKVAERSNRSYRGAIDVFAHNGALAVVNRVDMETYVATVVGSELDAAWPKEVLKAQAVAARTYVKKQGWKYGAGVANVADSTADQAYRGVEREYPAIVTAAAETAGEVLVRSDGTLMDAFYHSNAGNRTADPLEVWGTDIAGIESVPSLDDMPERNKLTWYRVVMPDGRVGYVRSDLLKLTGATNAGGFPLASASEAANVREAPFVNNDTNPSIGTLAAGTIVPVIDRDVESTAYRWIRGPVSADRLLQTMAASGIAASTVSAAGELVELEVTERGETSGRVTEMAMNGRTIPVNRPEQYRTLLGLPSGRFEVEETAKVTALGADGRTTELPSGAGGGTIVAAGARGAQTVLTSGYLIADGSGEARYATSEPAFRFHGTGFGHGLGMSQWGAYGLAELGYDYRKILQYYYKDAQVVKE